MKNYTTLLKTPLVTFLFFIVIATIHPNMGMAQGAGTIWTSRTSAADNSWNSVTYGNGLFVAVATTGTGNRVMTSPDGITWTSRTPAADNTWNSVTYGNGLFVAVAGSGTGNRVMTSTDGITWTSRTSAADNIWNSVTYGNGLFVAVAITGTGNRVMTSPNGITWTSRSAAADISWSSVTYGNGLFVAVSSAAFGYVVMTSPDGITWISRSAPTTTNWNFVTYGNGLFVAVGRRSTSTGTGIMTSPNGITWTTITAPVSAVWQSVTYGNGLFVAVSSNRVMTSPDGITWTTQTPAANNSWRSVTYGNGLFVAVASTGTGNRVMTSEAAAATCTNPVIDTDPDGQEVGLNETVSFITEASGSNLSYQWQTYNTTTQAWQNIAGATNTSYSLTSSLAHNQTQYRCVVSSGACSTTTETALLEVLDCTKPVITNGPVATMVYAGSTATYSVQATGTGLQYFWGPVIEGDLEPLELENQTSSYSIADVTLEMNNTVYGVVVISNYPNLACATFSSHATLEVRECTMPTPTLNYIAPVCANSSAFTLGGGSPASGWFTIDGIQATAFNPATLGQGSHLVKYWYGVEGCMAAASQNVTVKPVAEITFDEMPSLCSNAEALTLNFATPTGGTYSGTGVSQGVFNPATWATSEEPGAISYTYTNSSNCTATASLYPNVVMAPRVAPIEDFTVCLTADAFNLSNELGVEGVFTGTGVSDSVFNPALAGLGNHFISLTVSSTPDKGKDEIICSTTISFTIHVVAAPTLIFSPTTEVCANDAAFLLVGSPSNSKAGFKGTGVDENHYFNPALADIGENEITYFYHSENGCLATTKATIMVHALPTVNISSNSLSICQGEQTTLSTSNFSSYQWLFNDEKIEGETTANLSVEEAGIYSVVVSDAHCSNTATAVEVLVNQLPTPTIAYSGSPNFCVSSAITLDAGEYKKYQWLLNGHNIAGATNQTYAAANAGNYTVTVFDGYCYGTTSAVAVSGSSPVAVSSSGSSSLCAGESVTLTSSPASSYCWKLNGEKIQGANSASYSASASGNYSVDATDAFGCKASSAVVAITVNNLPTPSINTPSTTEICVGESVTLSTQTFDKYRWKKNNITIAGATSQSLTVSGSGSYTVQVFNEFGCKAYAPAVTVTVHELPDVTLNQSGLIFCQGDTFVVSVPAGNASYQWYNQGVAISGADNNELIVTQTGSYRVNVVSEFGCQDKSIGAIVIVKPAPTQPIISFTGNKLVAQTTESDMQWYYNASPITGATTPEIEPSSTGAYSIKVTNLEQCSNQSAYQLNALGINGIQAKGSTLVYPNPMTDVLNVVSSETGTYNLFDLNGKIVASSTVSQGNNEVLVSDLAKGIYQLNVNQQVFKVVK